MLKLPYRLRLNDLFVYDDGNLVYRKTGRTAGGRSCSHGYHRTTVDGVLYFTHRLIYKLVHGEDPEYVDHVNGDRADNRITNLRSVSKKENERNVKRHSTNTTGHTGVYKFGDRRWRAQICVDDKHIHLGTYDTLPEALQARKDAEKKYGFHANHGRASL